MHPALRVILNGTGRGVGVVPVAPTYLPTIGVSQGIVAGTSKMVSAYSGPSFRARNAAGAEQDIGWNGQTANWSDAFFSASGPFTVPIVYDQSGLGNNLTQPTVANQPILSFNTAVPEIILSGVDQCFLIPAAFVTDRANLGQFFVSRQYATGRTTQYARYGATPDLNIYAYSSQATLQVSGLSLISPTPLYAAVPQVGKDIVQALQRSGATVVGRGEALATSATGAGALALTAGGQIGGTQTSGNMVLYAFVAYPTTPGDSDATLVRAALRTIHGTGAASIVASILDDGDSITEGVGAYKGSPRSRLLGDDLGPTYVIHNIGISGATINAGKSPSFIVPGSHRKIYSLMIGTNNLGTGDTDATVISRIQTAVTNARANGFDKIIIGTIPCRSGSGWTTTMEGYRLSVNTAIRSGTITGIDAVWDNAADPTIGFDGTGLTDPARSSNNAAYFPDNLHPSPAGHVIMAGLQLAAVNAVMAQPLTLTISGTPAGATQNSAYAGFTPTVAGGVAPYAVSIVSGSLPAGLSLNTSTGAITGTTTGTGTSSFTLRVTDSQGTPRTADLATSIVVASAFAYLLDGMSASASAAYSTRKLRSAYAGACMKVRRSSDSTTLDIGFVNNILDTASLRTFAGSGSAFIDTWYDQSGNGKDFSQATTASQPRIVNSGVLDVQNTRASPLFSSTFLPTSTLSGSPSSARTVASVIRHNNASAAAVLSAGATGGYEFGINSTQNLRLLKYPSTAIATSTGALTVNTLQTALVLYDLTNYAFAIDGSAAGSGTASQTFTAGLNSKLGTGTANFSGYLPEEVLFDGALLSSGDQTFLQANQKAYFGTA